MSHKKFGPDRVSRFDVYWIQTNKQTNKQTDRQAKFIYRFITSSMTKACLHLKTVHNQQSIAFLNFSSVQLIFNPMVKISFYLEFYYVLHSHRAFIKGNTVDNYLFHGWLAIELVSSKPN